MYHKYNYKIYGTNISCKLQTWRWCKTLRLYLTTWSAAVEIYLLPENMHWIRLTNLIVIKLQPLCTDLCTRKKAGFIIFSQKSSYYFVNQLIQILTQVLCNINFFFQNAHKCWSAALVYAFVFLLLLFQFLISRKEKWIHD